MPASRAYCITSWRSVAVSWERARPWPQSAPCSAFRRSMLPVRVGDPPTSRRGATGWSATRAHSRSRRSTQLSTGSCLASQPKTSTPALSCWPRPSTSPATSSTASRMPPSARIPSPEAREVCGIAGWFGGGPPRPGAGARLARMIAAIAHRGPDGRGILTGTNFAFGHARLAIIDLQSGAQPMTSTDGAVSIVHNGEIYNYAELTAELQAMGQDFATRSDTEVILNTYRVHGVRGFARLRGMFAFALWDHRLNCGWLVRDRYGIKPLFHATDSEGQLMFASEVKALLPALERRASVDVEALHLLMNFRYLPGSRTLFRGISQLAPGTMLRWTPDSVRAAALDEYPDDRGLTPLAALEDSVRAHLTA